MSTDNTIFASNIYTTAIAFAVIIALGTFGLVNLFNGQVLMGSGLLISFFIMLCLFVWIDKFDHQEYE